MKIEMIKSQGASNDGIFVTRYLKGQTVTSPAEITEENAKIFVKNGIAREIESKIGPQNQKVAFPEEQKAVIEDDVEIIDLDEDEDEPTLANEPDVIKNLTEKPLFSRKKKSR